MVQRAKEGLLLANWPLKNFLTVLRLVLVSIPQPSLSPLKSSLAGESEPQSEVKKRDMNAEGTFLPLTRTTLTFLLRRPKLLAGKLVRLPEMILLKVTRIQALTTTQST